VLPYSRLVASSGDWQRNRYERLIYGRAGRLGGRHGVLLGGPFPLPPGSAWDEAGKLVGPCRHMSGRESRWICGRPLTARSLATIIALFEDKLERRSRTACG